MRNYIIYTFLSLNILILFGCSKKELTESQLNVSKDFISTTWYDNQIRNWDGEDVPNWLEFKVFDENGKLNFDYSREYSASFGDQKFVSPHKSSGETYEDQLIDIYYDTKKESLIYEFLENEKDENPYSLFIKIDQDSIETKLKRQIDSREKIKEYLDERKFSQIINYYNQSTKGIFQNRIISRRQNQDFSLSYGFFTETNKEFFDFDEDDLIILKGFYSEDIWWELKEKYNNDVDREIESKDLKFELSYEQVISILDLITNNDLSIYDTNIPGYLDSHPDDFRNSISFGNKGYKVFRKDWMRDSNLYKQTKDVELDTKLHTSIFSKQLNSIPIKYKYRGRNLTVKDKFLRIKIKDNYMTISSVILANGPQEGVSDCISPYCIDQEVEIEKYDVVYIENKIPSMVLLVKPDSSEYVALSK